MNSQILKKFDYARFNVHNHCIYTEGLNEKSRERERERDIEEKRIISGEISEVE